MKSSPTAPTSAIDGRGARRFGWPTALVARGCAALLSRYDARDVALELWNGEPIALPGSSASVRLRFRSPLALVRVLTDPEVQLPECYMDGTLAIDGDLSGLMTTLLGATGERASLRSKIAYRIGNLRARVLSKERSRRARSHYDLSNAFYALWLDESMTYTCAYFPDRSTTLEQAQTAKLELVCRKVGLSPGQHVIDAGCGWGSLALHMARHHGVTVTAYNVSREQVAYARARATREGLAGRVTFIEDDYRNLTGRCDAFVSVGMLEHVERRRYAELGRIIRRSLSPHGRALVHTIGRSRQLPPPRWTRRRIFPGGDMPTLAEIEQILEAGDFSILDVENLRLHYAQTLAHWLARFELVQDEARAMFDDRFVRMWRFYLASAQAGFRSGWLQLFQVVFTARDNDDIPWTRRGPRESG